jgi:uncharacterized protein YdcH (DUF465 family)
MDNATADSVKEQLMKENSSFRELVSKHKKYEDRLTQLSGLHYPSEEEQEEEVKLKRKKLAIKDEIYEMISNFTEKRGAGH